MNGATVWTVQYTGRIKVGKRWADAEQMTDGTVLRILANGDARDTTPEQAATFQATGSAFGNPLCVHCGTELALYDEDGDPFAPWSARSGDGKDQCPAAPDQLHAPVES